MDSAYSDLLTGLSPLITGLIASGSTLVGYMFVSHQRIKATSQLESHRDSFAQMHQLYEELKRDLAETERKHERCQYDMEQLRNDFIAATADRDRMHQEIIALKLELKKYVGKIEANGG